MQKNFFMIEIGNTIVSFEVLEQCFCCDLNTCHGDCCIEGDSGAPLEEEEFDELKKIVPVIWDDISDECRKVIESQGVAYRDEDGDLVTSIVNNRECVFSYTDKDGTRKCAIEKAYREKKISFYKPISCHLYPIRLTEYKDFTAVNYHKWQVCHCAEVLGNKLKLPVYKFLKEPLVRKFGVEWYNELEQAAKDFQETYKNIE